MSNQISLPPLSIIIGPVVIEQFWVGVGVMEAAGVFVGVKVWLGVNVAVAV